MTSASPPSAGSNDPSKQARPKRILVVEDEALIALDLGRRLKRLGFEVVGIADSYDDALELYARSTPDLVLMDIFIRPPLDGIETARALARMGDAPVVFLTAFADDATVRRASEVSPYGYILKPFDERTLLATITVVLERHSADKKVRLLAAAVESATVGIALVEIGPDGTSQVVLTNGVYAGLSSAFGGAGGPGSALPWMFEGEALEESFEVLRRAFERREPGQGTVTITRPTGERAWISITVSPISRSDGRTTHVSVFYLDVSKQRAAETGMAESQRMEVVGRLTAGIAHDFNNILAVIITFTGLAREGIEDSERGADLDEVIRAAKRGELLTRKLLDFTRRNDVLVAGVVSDLTQVVSEARGMLERLASPMARVTFELDSTCAPIRLDPTSIEQILMNLVSNARDAMTSTPGPVQTTGAITVRSSRIEVAGAEEPACVRLEVIDDGAGMEPSVTQHIFDPLFTTKPRGMGTGLGLSTTKMLVDRAGGTIRVRSAPGRGTVFELEFPMDAGQADSSQDREASEGPFHVDGMRCLLVEDDHSLRTAAARGLSTAGFRVVEASSGEAACAAIEAHGATFDIVVSDMVLPGAGGAQVFEAARKFAPNAALLATTGYFDPDLSPVLAQVEVLWKPYTIPSLARRAADAVAKRRSS